MKKEDANSSVKEMPSSTLFRPDYPYKAVGEELDVSHAKDGEAYEIRRRSRKMGIRSQGQDKRNAWNRLKESDCIGYGIKVLFTKRVDMSKAPAKQVLFTAIPVLFQ